MLAPCIPHIQQTLIPHTTHISIFTPTFLHPSSCPHPPVPTLPPTLSPTHFPQTAREKLQLLWSQGYAAIDIIGTLFRLTKVTAEGISNDRLRLAFVREIGVTHMRIADGIDSFLQLTALLSRLCMAARDSHDHELRAGQSAGQQPQQLGQLDSPPVSQF